MSDNRLGFDAYVCHKEFFSSYPIVSETNVILLGGGGGGGGS